MAAVTTCSDFGAPGKKNKVGLKLNIQKLSDVCVVDIFF